MLQAVNFKSQINSPTQEMKPEVKTAKKLSKSALAGIALGGLAVCGAAIYFATKGKAKMFKPTPEQEAKLQELIKEKKIDEAHIDLFKKIFSRKDENFIQDIYKDILEFHGMKVAPELKLLPEKGVMGAFKHIKGEMYVYGKPSLDTIFHETTHYRQMDTVYRAFGKEKMVDALTECHLNRLKMNPKACEKKFNKTFENIKKEELDKYTQEYKEKMLKDFNTEFYEKAKAAHGELTPEQMKKAEAYLEAMKCPLPDQTIIEREAYHESSKFSNMFNEFKKIMLG